MARTNIPLSAFVPNGSLLDPAGTDADGTNGHVVAPGTGWPDATLEEIVLRVANGGVGATVVTVVKGDNPPALESAADYTESVAAGATEWLGPFTSAQFWHDATATDAAGLWFDVSVETDVTITAFRTPRTA